MTTTGSTKSGQNILLLCNPHTGYSDVSVDNGCVYCSSTGQVDRSALIQCGGDRGSDGESELWRRN